jgi:hypothetical protein
MVDNEIDGTSRGRSRPCLVRLRLRRDQRDEGSGVLSGGLRKGPRPDWPPSAPNTGKSEIRNPNPEPRSSATGPHSFGSRISGFLWISDFKLWIYAAACVVRAARADVFLVLEERFQIGSASVRSGIAPAPAFAFRFGAARGSGERPARWQCQFPMQCRLPSRTFPTQECGFLLIACRMAMFRRRERLPRCVCGPACYIMGGP